MPAGRPPKPTYLKIVQGKPGHRPLNEDEPEPVGDLEAPPANFSPDQQALWISTLADTPAGLVRRLDFGVFTSYIVNLEQFLASNQQVNVQGAVIPNAEGDLVQNPNAIARSRANVEMVKAASELGFTPSSRSRVKITGKKKNKSPFGKLKTLDV